jgi:hypothetical protein
LSLQIAGPMQQWMTRPAAKQFRVLGIAVAAFVPRSIRRTRFPPRLAGATSLSRGPARDTQADGYALSAVEP